MQNEIRASLVYICRRVLHPLIRILIRFGISAGELKAIVDSVYAHAGSEYLVSQGERVTYSRLAVITGINRSFLPSILESPRDEFHPRSSTQLHRAARVLSGWYEDLEFQNRSGEPAVLPIRGSHSFEELTRRYSGGVYPQTLLSELLRLGAVRLVGRDRVRPTRRSLSIRTEDSESLLFLGDTAGQLLLTLEHNLTAPAHEQRPVRSLAVRAATQSLPLFRSQVGRRADGMLDAVEAFLQAHPVASEARADGKPTDGLVLGATVFATCSSGADDFQPDGVATPKKGKR